MNFAALITQNWEGKFSFKRGGQTLVPKFAQNFEDDQANMADAHYVVRLRDGQGGNELVSSKPAQIFEALATAGVYFPMASTMAKGSAEPTNSSGLIANALPTMFPCYVDAYNGVIKDQTKARVQSLARQVAGLSPATKVYVTGYGTSKNASQSAVINLLRAGGLTNVNARNSAKFLKPSTWGTQSQSKASGRTDYVKISLDGGLDLALISQPLYTYPAACVHEFGHMLGLKDEYACLSAGAAERLVNLDFIEASEKALYLAQHYAGARLRPTRSRHSRLPSSSIARRRAWYPRPSGTTQRASCRRARSSYPAIS